MRRLLGIATLWLAFGAGAQALAQAAALAPAAGAESTWPHLPSFRRRPDVPKPGPSAPAVVKLQSARVGRSELVGQRGVEERDSSVRVRVEHEGYLCVGVEGVDRKQITTLKQTGDKVTRSAHNCAAGVEQDEQCGQELYSGTSKDGRWHCACVLRGRTCLKQVAPEGALFSVFVIDPKLSVSPPPSHGDGAPQEAGAESQEEAEPRAAQGPSHREKVTSLHSHAVLRGLIAAPAREELTRIEQFEAQWDPGSERSSAPPPEVPTLPPQSQPPQDELLGRLGGGSCAGSPVVYDGPTMGWEDCRTKCANHRCRFWSYWPDSMQHRCRLTTGCRRRERDYHHNVSVYRGAQTSTDDGDDQAAEDDVQEANQTEEQVAQDSRQNCLSPHGTARKFVASPQSGWHNLGRVDSYVNCSNTAGSMGYRNLVYNIGSIAKGRCYGFASDIPEVHSHGCEDGYCWLFGPACESAGHGEETVQKFIGRSIRLNSKSHEISSAKVMDFVKADLRATQEAKQAVRMAEEGEARAEEHVEEDTRKAEKGEARSEAGGQENVINMDSVEGDRQATHEADRKSEEDQAHTIEEVARTIAEAGQAAQEVGQAAPEAEKDEARAEEHAEEDVMDMDSKSEETAKGKAEHQATPEANQTDPKAEEELQTIPDALQQKAEQGEALAGSVEAESRAMQEVNQLAAMRRARDDKAHADEFAMGMDTKNVETAKSKEAKPNWPTWPWQRKHSRAKQEAEAKAKEEAEATVAKAREEAEATAAAEADVTELPEAVATKKAEADEEAVQVKTEAAVTEMPEAEVEEKAQAKDNGTEEAEASKTVAEVAEPAEAEAKQKAEATAKDKEEAEETKTEAVDMEPAEAEAKQKAEATAQDTEEAEETKTEAVDTEPAEAEAKQKAEATAEDTEETEETKTEANQADLKTQEDEARAQEDDEHAVGLDAKNLEIAKAAVEEPIEADHQATPEVAVEDPAEVKLNRVIQISRKNTVSSNDKNRNFVEADVETAGGKGEALAVDGYGKRHAKDAVERIRRTVLETKQEINEGGIWWKGEEAKALEEAKRKVEEVAEGGAEAELEAWGKATLDALTNDQTQGESTRRSGLRAALEGAVQLSQGARKKAEEEAKRKVEEVAKGGAEQELETRGKATLEALADGQKQGQSIRRNMRGALHGAGQVAQEAKHEARVIEDYGKKHARDAAELIKRTVLEMKKQISEADGEYEGEEAQMLEVAKKKVEEVARAGTDAELEAWGKAALEAMKDGQTQSESIHWNKTRAALEEAVRMLQEARQKAEEDEVREKRAGDAAERIKRIVSAVKKIRHAAEDPGEAARESTVDYGSKHAKDAIEHIKKVVLDMKQQIKEAEGEYEGEEATALEEAKRQVEDVAKGGAQEELMAWGKAMLAASMDGEARGESLREIRTRAALRAALRQLSASKSRAGARHDD